MDCAQGINVMLNELCLGEKRNIAAVSSLNESLQANATKFPGTPE